MQDPQASNTNTWWLYIVGDGVSPGEYKRIYGTFLCVKGSCQLGPAEDPVLAAQALANELQVAVAIVEEDEGELSIVKFVAPRIPTSNPTHVPPSQQPVQIGDRGGDEYDTMICTGYEVSSRPGPGFPYNTSRAWWHESDAPHGWYMGNPTGSGIIPVPEDLNISATFETPEAIAAQEEFCYSA